MQMVFVKISVLVVQIGRQQCENVKASLSSYCVYRSESMNSSVICGSFPWTRSILRLPLPETARPQPLRRAYQIPRGESPAYSREDCISGAAKISSTASCAANAMISLSPHATCDVTPSANLCGAPSR